MRIVEGLRAVAFLFDRVGEVEREVGILSCDFLKDDGILRARGVGLKIKLKRGLHIESCDWISTPALP